MSHPQTQEVLIDTAHVQLTTAIDTAHVHLEPLVVEGQQPDGQLTTTIDTARGGLTP